MVLSIVWTCISSCFAYQEPSNSAQEIAMVTFALGPMLIDKFILIKTLKMIICDYFTSTNEFSL
jgi:hypothetical protein